MTVVTPLDIAVINDPIITAFLQLMVFHCPSWCF